MEDAAQEVKKTVFPLERRGVRFEFIKDTEHSRIVKASLFSRSWFESFERKINKARVIDGVELPASEAFPNDEAFGKWAFLSETIEGAELKAAEIDAKVNARVERQ